MRIWQRIVPPLLYLVKDGSDTSLQAGKCGSLEEVWKVAVNHGMKWLTRDFRDSRNDETSLQD